MYYRPNDPLELVMSQDDKLSELLEETDERLDKMLRTNQEILSEHAYITESYEPIDYNVLSLLEESDSVDMVDMEVDDLIDSNEINDDVGSIIDIIAGL